MLDSLKSISCKSYLSARALLYTIESAPLPILNRLITGDMPYVLSDEQEKFVIQQARDLIELESKEVANGTLPLVSIAPGAPTKHVQTLTKVLVDSVFSFWRRRTQQTQSFSHKIESLDEYPDYYRRNFHHQTDGYLSEKSASLYNMQVEMLFKGMANPMRRRLLKPLKQHNQDVRKILEVGAGCGTFTKFLAQTFPNAKIYATDLSSEYVAYAKRELAQLKNVYFSTANAEELPFKDQEFDICTSVFMHHELPYKNRMNTLDEMIRVTKSDGIVGVLDSLQIGDTPELDWALNEFPKTFHEPFYKNYVNKNLKKELTQRNSNINVSETPHFLSKSVIITSK